MQKLLMTPGPTTIPEAVKLEMAKDIIHHRTEEYSEIFKELSENLKYVFKTKDPVITLTSSGTGAMEASVTNLFSKGDKVIVISAGNFGNRFIQLTKLYGLDVKEISYKWGESAKPEDLEKVLSEEENVKGVFLTHHETSTGVLNDVSAFGKVLEGTDILFVVDSISGILSNEFKTDEWRVDCAISGSQKGFMTPPGLAFVSLSERAQAAMKKSDMPNFYFSFAKHLNRLPEGQNPTTPAITLIFAANVACQLIKKEGIDNVLARHKKLQTLTALGVEALGLEFFVKNSEDRGSTLTSVIAPEGIDGQEIHKLMQEEGVTIAGGQADYKGKIFRIGHLGDVNELDVIVTFSALEKVLYKLNYREFEIGSSVKAIQEYLIKNI